MKPPEKTQVVKNIVSGSMHFEHKYIPNRNTLASVVNTLKDAGYRIVLTQGVYDLFHVGHKRYLEHAKSHGDILIIGVDTDELTRKRKGPNRPFDVLEDRLEILASLRAVDIVTTRGHEEDIDDLVRVVRPDVFIMSETTTDFKTQNRTLLQYCQEVKILPVQASTSTSAKLRRMMVDGAEQLAVRITDLINEFLIGIKDEKSSSTVHPSGTSRASRLPRKTKLRRPIHTRKKSNK